MKTFIKSQYDNIRDHMIERQNEQLDKIFKPEEYKDKYILWIIPQLYFPYAESPQCSIHLFSKDKRLLALPTCKLRTPHPNKNIKVFSCRSGRKVVAGIPLIFDTFEELKDVSRLNVIWHIPSYMDFLSSYHISFKKSKTERVYTASTYNLMLCTEESVKEFLKEYDNIYHITNTEEDISILPVGDNKILLTSDIAAKHLVEYSFISELDSFKDKNTEIIKLEKH